MNIPARSSFRLPNPPARSQSLAGLILAEEIEGTAQDAVEVEPRDFAMFDDPPPPGMTGSSRSPAFFAFGDQGIYNIGLRPNNEDIGRGGN